MEQTELREAIAAAIYYYQQTGEKVRPFEPEAAMRQWVEWLGAAGNTSGSVRHHRAAADRVIAMCAHIWSGARLPAIDLAVADALRDATAAPAEPEPVPLA